MDTIPPRPALEDDPALAVRALLASTLRALADSLLLGLSCLVIEAVRRQEELLASSLRCRLPDRNGQVELPSAGEAGL
jgi:hypothetical protein